MGAWRVLISRSFFCRFPGWIEQILCLSDNLANVNENIFTIIGHLSVHCILILFLSNFIVNLDIGWRFCLHCLGLKYDYALSNLKQLLKQCNCVKLLLTLNQNNPSIYLKYGLKSGNIHLWHYCVILFEQCYFRKLDSPRNSHCYKFLEKIVLTTGVLQSWRQQFLKVKKDMAMSHLWVVLLFYHPKPFCPNEWCHIKPLISHIVSLQFACMYRTVKWCMYSWHDVRCI